MATYIVEHYIDFPDKTDAQLLVLCGMCASFGALFPTPVLAVLLIYELGTPPKPFMETIVTLSAGALASYCVYYQFAPDFYLSHLSSNGVLVSVIELYFDIHCYDDDTVYVCVCV